MDIWQFYRTDAGRMYPFYAVSARQVNDISTNLNPLDLLPSNDLTQLINFSNPCSVPGLTPRKIMLYAVDGAQFLINYWQPFNQNLFDFLTLNIDVAAFEFIGERIKYGRLRRMLDNV